MDKEGVRAVGSSGAAVGIPYSENLDVKYLQMDIDKGVLLTYNSHKIPNISKGVLYWKEISYGKRHC